jgi:GDP-4-dehydro-6-deoxy-D-mannose reductase
MKTVIIGAAGFVGGYLVRELQSAGHTVVAVDMPQVNLLDKTSVDTLIEQNRPDFVVNLAAVSSVGASWKNPEATIQVNVVGTIHLLEAVAQFAPKAKTLLIGSAEEYAPKRTPLSEDDPLEACNPYGISKIAQENFAEVFRKQHGLKIVCTRSFNHTGIGQTTTFALPSFCKQAAEIDKSGKDGKIFVGNLSAIRDFSDVQDVVHVYRMLLESENHYDVYNVGSGKAYPISELLDYIVSLASVKIEIVQDPAKMRPVDNPYICADNSRISKIFPGTDIHETIKEMFLDFKAKAAL